MHRKHKMHSELQLFERQTGFINPQGNFSQLGRSVQTLMCGSTLFACGAVDSSESSGESVSGFSSSGHSCLSVIGGEVEESPSEGPGRCAKTSTTQGGAEETTDEPTPITSPASRTRDQSDNKVCSGNRTPFQNCQKNCGRQIQIGLCW